MGAHGGAAKTKERSRMSARVSLALPVYNGEAFVAAAIESILAQTLADFVLVITDNASTDGTQDLCRAFAARDARIRYVRNDRNIGASANYNRGYELTSGEYFKWCAHDDCISPNFLEQCVRALDGDPEAVIAYGMPQSIDQYGRVSPWEGFKAPDMDGLAANARFRLVSTAQGFDTAVFGLFRRSALAKTNLHRDYYGSDIALLAEMALLGRFLPVPDAVFFNRDHPGRSIHIVDHAARQAWQNPRSRRRGLENLSLLFGLLRIAYRHRDAAALRTTVPFLLAWAMRPRQLTRYALDLIGMASPSLRHAVRQAGLSVLNRLPGTGSALKAQATARQQGGRANSAR
jgi:glycosyltransferase involved in cell wall biosynthesis